MAIPIDQARLRRRTKALTELWQHAEAYDARCVRQGWEPGTAPRVLAHHEIAHEQTVEAFSTAEVA